MNKFVVFAMMVIGVTSIHAQKVTRGSFCALANENIVSVTIDYKNAKIDKVPFEVFVEGEEEWEKDYKSILLNFVKAANRSGGGIKYVTKPTCSYQLVFRAIVVDDDGETTGDLLLLDKNSNVIGVAEKFHAEGGRFGSQTNLMGDAAERLGKKVGSFIKKAAKK